MDFKEIIGPYGALFLSVSGIGVIAVKFFAANDTLVRAFRAELDSCHKRYDFLLGELMKLQEKHR